MEIVVLSKNGLLVLYSMSDRPHEFQYSHIWLLFPNPYLPNRESQESCASRKNGSQPTAFIFVRPKGKGLATNSALTGHRPDWIACSLTTQTSASSQRPSAKTLAPRLLRSMYAWHLHPTGICNNDRSLFLRIGSSHLVCASLMNAILGNSVRAINNM